MKINWYVLLMFGSSLITSISQLLLKKGANIHFKNIIRQYINFYVITGYILLLISMFMNIIGYKGVEYKIGSILVTSSYIFVMLIGKLFFHEEITKYKIIGIFLIVFGIFVYNI